MFRVHREPRRRLQGGFTLVELLVVAAILLILAVIALPVYAQMTDKTRVTVGKTHIKEIEKALEQYRAANGYYPNKLGLLVDAGHIRGEYLETPWSTPDFRLYYFYAVDVADRPRGYALGDPGPKPEAGCTGGESVTLWADPPKPSQNNKPLPCGRHPDDPRGAWVFSKITIKPDDSCKHEVNQGLYKYNSLSGCRADLITEL